MQEERGFFCIRVVWENARSSNLAKLFEPKLPKSGGFPLKFFGSARKEKNAEKKKLCSFAFILRVN